MVFTDKKICDIIVPSKCKTHIKIIVFITEIKREGIV